MEETEKDKSAIGERFAGVVRTCYNDNQSACARDIGITKGSLSGIIQGRNYPGFKAIRNLLAKNPSISPDWLILGKSPSTRTVNESEEKLRERIAELEFNMRKMTETFKSLGI